ncbi:DUF397 domain-containing protein [Uniformispora flossi]|uniref:DUF397 domain-containing protein n=1 Tax=Uniformispora flossi TaxID=3390723 RepID=UPI003C2F74BF
MNGELVWRKSSYSDHQGGACVEVAWRKSSYSDHQGGECVEVATTAPGLILLRDSKITAGPRLTVGPTAWNALLSATARDLKA